MRGDTKREIIKALTYGEDIEDIANMAEVETEEITRISEVYADEIRKRREEITGGTKDGN